MSSSDKMKWVNSTLFNNRSIGVPVKKGDCGRGYSDNFGNWNLIQLLKNGEFDLTDEPNDLQFAHVNSNWNKCNRQPDPEGKSWPEAANPVKLNDLNDGELNHVLELINESFDTDDNLLSLITKNDVYNFFLKKMRNLEMDEAVKKLKEHGAEHGAEHGLVDEAAAAADKVGGGEGGVGGWSMKHVEGGKMAAGGGEEGDGKKSRRKRTKRRTKGGKKSRRRLRKRTTIKGGKRKPRKTRRRK